MTANQRSAAIRFSAAAGDLGTLAANEFVRTRQDVIDMNMLRQELGDTLEAGLDGGMTVERTRIRVQAAEALKEYGELLGTLTSHSEKDQIKAATESFLGSLRKVEGVALNDAQTGAIQQAVESVGGLLIEHLRKQAAREVVEAAHPSVVALAGLLVASFEAEGEEWSLAYETSATALEGAALLPSAGRENAAKARSVVERNRLRFEGIADQLILAAKDVAAAHEALNNVIIADEVSVERITEFVSEVQNLAQVYTILRAP